MRVLFAISHPGFLRNFESGLRALLRRGHAVHVVLERDADTDAIGGAAIHVLERAGADGTLTHAITRGLFDNEWSALARQLRMARDFWRYVDPLYDDARLLRERVRAETPAFATGLLAAPLLRPVADRVVHAIERRLPISAAVSALLDAARPEVVVVTPLVYIGSDQVQLLRAARRRGIPVVYAAGSWDHLTTKGLVHDLPDVAVVWNEAQRRECVRLHGVPDERVRVAGAQAFDHWFEQRPLVDRETFCTTIGVPADRPLLLYLCSSTFIAGDERAQVREWVAAVRGATPPVSGAAILIRPHPQNAAQWRDETFDDPLVAVWPRAGANPVGDAARADFFHSLYFSDAVVGVNTSAQIESAIVGRPVFTISTDRYAGTQRGTLHFRLLSEPGGGLLHVARGFDEHVAQLQEALARRGEMDPRSQAFVRSFVRPLDRSAGDVFAEAVEGAVPTGGSPAETSSLIARLVRPLAGAADAAGKIRAVSAPVRYQSWFLPAPQPFRVEHRRVPGALRVACAASVAADVERAAALSAGLAAAGGRMLLCLPDGSEAGAAAKRLHGSLVRVTTVGIPASAGPDAVRLVLQKFRADHVLSFSETAAASIGVEVAAAARRLGVTTVVAPRASADGQLLRLPPSPA